MMPTDAVVAVTFRCNCRCAMCNIWRLPPGRELPPDAYRRLPRSLRDVNITGGEPFLRDDIEEILGAVREACPRARIVVSTNGLLTRKIRQTVRHIARHDSRLGLAVSIDGIGPVHNRIRGVEGAYDRARRTVDLVREEGLRNLRLAFTATPENVDQLAAVYDLSRELGVEFTLALAHASEHYFHSCDSFALPPGMLKDQVAHVIAGEMRGWSLKRWARAYFLHGAVQFSLGLGRPLPCRAGEEMFFLSPEGDVYPCNVFSARMGNLEAQEFSALWHSPEAGEVRRRLAHCRHGCWMVCSARTAMRRHWPKVAGWILRCKLLGRCA